MASLFGTSNFDPFGDLGWSYAGDNSGAIAAGVIVDAPGDTIDGIRVYLPYFTATDASATGIRAYLYEFTSSALTNKTLRTTGIISSPTPGWNTIDLDSSISDSGKKFLALVYFPWGGFTYKPHGYDTDVVSGDDSSLVAQSSGDIAAINSSLGNGVFIGDTISDPANPPANPSLTTFNATNYGVDVAVTLGAGTPTAPSNSTAPHITTDGTPQTGESVSCSQGTWSGDATITYAYQWKRGSTSISGATSSNYTLQVADVGQTIKCTVTATNGAGSVSQDSDNTITPSAPPSGAPSNSTPPAITGSAQEGQTLTCSTGTWTNTPTSYAYQWKRAGSNISGATSSTYTVQASDVGQAVKCTITATNGSGSASVDSNTVTPTAQPDSGSLVGEFRVNISGDWVDVDLGGGTAVLNEPAPVFRPDKYTGWVGDGTTSDLTAWRDCLADLFQTGLDNGTYFGKLQMPAGVSYVGGTPIKVNTGGLVLHSLIPLMPRVAGDYQALPMTAKKFILELSGTLDQAVHQHWKQTVIQDAGCIVRSDAAPSSGDRTTYGRPSVFGCPTVDSDVWGSQSGGGGGAMESKWNNIIPVINGVGILLPVDPHICGFDLRSAANANVINAAVIAELTGVGGLTIGDASATQDWQFGLATPGNNNNAQSRLGKFVGIGQNYGAMINEHTVFDSIVGLFCTAAVEFGSEGGTGHTITGQRILAENCQVGVGAVEGGWATKIEVNDLSFESISFALVNDNTHQLLGTIRNATGIGPSNPLVNGTGNGGIRGAENLRVYDGSIQSGVYNDSGARQMPNSATEKRNPFFRDTFFRFTANAPTDVAIRSAGAGAAVSIGAPNIGEWIPLPTGAFVTLTWTGTRPSAQWMVS